MPWRSKRLRQRNDGARQGEPRRRLRDLPRSLESARCGRHQQFPGQAGEIRGQVRLASSRTRGRVFPSRRRTDEEDRKEVVQGKSVEVRVDLGGCRNIKKEQTLTTQE